MNRNIELIKNTIILAVGALAPKLIAFFTLPIVTNALTKEEYGKYDLVLTVASILIPVVTLQIQQAVFRFLVGAKNEEEKRAYVSSSMVYLAISMGVVLVVCTIALLLCRVSPILSLGIGGMMFFEACYIVLGQALRGVGCTVKYSFSVILYAVVNLLFILVYIVWLKLGLNGIIYSMACSYFITTVYMLRQQELKDSYEFKSVSIETLKEMLAFSAPIVPSTISLWIVNLSDRMVITAFLGVGMNGIYSVANKIPQLFSTGYSIFNMAWTETASRAVDDSDTDRYYSDMFEKLFDFLIGFMLCLVAVTPLIFDVLIDPEYNDAYYQMPILFFGVFFNSLVSFYGSIYIAMKNTKHVATTTVVGAIINLLINILFVQKIGLYAASISTVVSYIVVTVYRCYDIDKMIRISYKKDKIIIGLLLFLIAAVLCYFRNWQTILLCVLIAILYNMIYNFYLVKLVSKFVKSKVRRKQ